MSVIVDFRVPSLLTFSTCLSTLPRLQSLHIIQIQSELEEAVRPTEMKTKTKAVTMCDKWNGLIVLDDEE